MSLRDIYLANPKAIYLFFLLFIIGISFLLIRKKQRENEEKFLSPLINRRDSFYYNIKMISYFLALIFAIFAFMQPVGYGAYPKNLPEAKNDKKFTEPFYILIDTSLSMSIQDGRNNLSRLQVALDITDALISNLRGSLISLNTFTSEINEITPLTTDFLFTRLILRQIEINEGGIPGTDFETSLNQMVKILDQESQNKIKNLILLSDGDDTKESINLLEKTINKMTDEKVNIYTIGIGSLKGEKVPDIFYQGQEVNSALNEKLLKFISQTGKGAYLSGNDKPALDVAENLILNVRSKENVSKEMLNTTEILQSNLIQKHYYQYFLALSLIFLSVALFLRETNNLKI